MREDSKCVSFPIMRSVFHGNQMSDADKQLVSDNSMAGVVELASKHDIAHLVALGIINNELADEQTKSQLQQIIFRAVYLYEKLIYELKQVCEALEKAQIPFLPLKGTVIRKYYPEAWMRTSCDIDVLVHDKDAEKAKSVLVDEYGYVYHGKGSHDISLFTPTNTHIELHYDLVEDGIANESSEVLKNV